MGLRLLPPVISCLRLPCLASQNSCQWWYRLGTSLVLERNASPDRLFAPWSISPYGSPQARSLPMVTPSLYVKLTGTEGHPGQHVASFGPKGHTFYRYLPTDYGSPASGAFTFARGSFCSLLYHPIFTLPSCLNLQYSVVHHFHFRLLFNGFARDKIMLLAAFTITCCFSVSILSCFCSCCRVGLPCRRP